MSVSSPAGGASVQGTIPVNATAADNVAVAGVQFTLDGANLGAEDTSAPYSVCWNTTTAANGTHVLRAIARDAATNSTTSTPVSVTVANPVPDTTPPTVSVSSPAEGATVLGSVPVNASASDNVGVDGVQFTLDGANLGAEDTSAPYSVSWNTTTASNGAHALRAIARDAAGNSTTATPVNVTVANPSPDTTPPTVSVTAPAAGATVSGTATPVSATAADNVGVTSVQFTLDGANLGAADTSAPYSVSWNTTTASNGSHTLRAIARDAATNSTTSVAGQRHRLQRRPAGHRPGRRLRLRGDHRRDRHRLLGRQQPRHHHRRRRPHRRRQDRPRDRLRRGQRLRLGGRRQQPRSHHRHDHRGLGAAGHGQLLAHHDPEGEAGRPGLLALRQLLQLPAPGRDRHGSGAGTDRLAGIGPALTAGTWTHLAVTYDNAQLRLFRNGVQVVQSAATGAIQASASPLRIGGNAIWGEYTDGRIDEVRIYNRALSAAEITTDMTRPVVG